MSLICFASQKGSPGTTLTALTVAAAWPGTDEHRRVFVEADRAGGALALRYGIGTEPGLLTLAAAVRSDPAVDLRAHAQPIPGGLPAVIGPDSPAQVEATLAAAGDSLGKWLGEQDGTSIADIGRLESTGTAHPFIAHATTSCRRSPSRRRTAATCGPHNQATRARDGSSRLGPHRRPATRCCRSRSHLQHPGARRRRS